MSWQTQVVILKRCLRRVSERFPAASNWGVLFEYPLLRLGRRLDVVILAGKRVVVIEFKVGARSYSPADVRQAETYALDLRDFHEASHLLPILPVLCATDAPRDDYTLSDQGGVGRTCLCNAVTLGKLLEKIASVDESPQIDLGEWDRASYRPVPDIIKAAELLFAGHQVHEIADASCNPENLAATTDKLIQIISRARRHKEHIVAFVTGVPGSGKTLVGLNAIHDPRFRREGGIAGAYLSGNTPLVEVLREALAQDEAGRTGTLLRDARRKVRSQIQGVMNYLKEYLESDSNEAPADHVIVFDEAQRAWDAAHGAQKFDLPKSEPALFLEIMGRHIDWAVIIGLVGGGQEINKGEKGLSEWGAAVLDHNRQTESRKWRVIAAKEATAGADATAWQTIFPGQPPNALVERDETLHLAVSVRSYRCLATSRWVNALLDGQIDDARSIATTADEFPIFVTRSLSKARQWLLEEARGNRRCGLVATTGAQRLRAEGLGVPLSAAKLKEVVNWYLKPRGDIRSSCALEVTANEYTCQGLELDYVGVCWGGDLLWNDQQSSWDHRALMGSSWHKVKNPYKQRWVSNKYRVLLTRSRLGTVIWVPEGNAEDATRNPKLLNTVASILTSAGATPLG